ncbi:hypothetical protein C8R45DRAFT_850309, partial [Mycena sanguinolenta]
YQRFQTQVTDLVGSRADAIVISRLGDDLDEFAQIVAEATIFEPDEFNTIQTRRPRIYIDPEFLRWAYGQRSIASIVRYLGVGRSTVRNALLEHGIAQSQSSPFSLNSADPGLEDSGLDNSGLDDILEPTLPDLSAAEVEELAAPSQPTTLFTGPLSEISDDGLDTLLIRLRTHYRRAGLSMLNGMLRRLGHRISAERLHQSLLCIDPVRRIFERICIRRQNYQVLGPNSLWHHDGQHGKSVHNVRIERLWVDVTAQVGATWADCFIMLEVRNGLDINNVAHIWLLHFLFLGTINSQLAFFAGAWNQHRIQMCGSTNRSPTDMFVFDMFINGVRGDQLPPEEEGLDDDELEVYGIDWQGLREDGILHSQAQNNRRDEGSSSWLGRTGPPTDLSQVDVQPPPGTLTDAQVEHLYHSFSHLIGSAVETDIILLWTQALAHVRVLYPDVF